MIAGIGVDIVEIQRMEQSLSRLGEAFARRILADSELREFQQHKFPGRFLAKRFAAKEATVKALGTGFSQGISLRHIRVEHDEQGKPELQFQETALQVLQNRAIQRSHLSIADETHYAIAYVILEKS